MQNLSFYILFLLSVFSLASCGDESEIVNTKPVFTGNTNFNIEENSLIISSVYASDIDGDPVSYSISGGIDQSLFIINAETGVLSALNALDFELPLDSDFDNIYQIDVSATDGNSAQTVSLNITVINQNDNAPVFSSPDTVIIAEGTTAIQTVIASDADNDTLSYSISGGVDASFFNINSSSGVLSFNFAPDYGTQLDDGANNIYNIQATAFDGLNSTNQQIAITVTDNNIPPVITSENSASVVENVMTVITVTASDSDPVSFSLSGGIDQARFNINSTSGVLTFIIPPDFETPTDSNGDNIYLLQVSASDSLSSTTQDLSVSVTNVNDIAPAFTTSNAETVVEGNTNVMTVSASDSEGDTVSYTLTGGLDEGLFNIGPSSGVLSFNSAPDYGNPLDDGANNIYNIQVTASDGFNSTNLPITVTVVADAANLPPVINSASNVSIDENITDVITVSATDSEGDAITYAITGGSDQGLFSINDISGALTFKSPSDYEDPVDSDANNSYLVQVGAGDASNISHQLITVSINNTNDNGPVFTSSATPSIVENNVSVLTVTTTDADDDTVTYTISGGTDQEDFIINSASGILTFIVPPDYETPADSNGDNVYLLQVSASDGLNSVTQDLTVSVADANDVAPVFTSPSSVSVAENTSVSILTIDANDAEGDTVSYSITGGLDQSLFSVDSSSGALSFNSAPDFETPLDSDENNSYLLQVTASDTVNATNQTVTITVSNLNDNAPAFTTSSTVNIVEGNTSIITVNANDADGNTVTYSVTGGVDQNEFGINSSSGALSFNSAPDYNAPSDSDGDNVYIVQITANDTSNTTNQTISVTILEDAQFNGIVLTRIFSDLSFNKPLLMLQNPTNSNRWYVVEQGGGIKTLLSSSTSTTDFANINVLTSGNEMGLLGMAFHPDFSSNNYVYLYYSTGSSTSGADHDSVIVRYTASSETSLDTGSGEEIIRIAEPYSNHNGGNIVFGSDGYLYIGTGDGGNGGDPLNNAQNIDSLLGKMLRIDVDSGSPYSSPADNPFVGISGSDEIYALGLRNPWRWSFDSLTGALIAADVGQGSWEEVDIIVKGGNYGWRCYEGTHAYNTSGCNDPGSYVQPIFEYDHNVGTMPGGYSITGGYVYRGSNISALVDSYIFTDYVTARIWRLESPYGTPVFSELSDSTGFDIASFAEDSNGELYVLDLAGGGIYRIDPQ